VDRVTSVGNVNVRGGKKVYPALDVKTTPEESKAVVTSTEKGSGGQLRRRIDKPEEYTTGATSRVENSEGPTPFGFSGGAPGGELRECRTDSKDHAGRRGFEKFLRESNKKHVTGPTKRSR